MRGGRAAVTQDHRKAPGPKGPEQPAPDGPARVVKPGDWGAVSDGALRGFTLSAFAVPGRAAPKPDPAESRVAELERKLKRAEEAHREALQRAAQEGEARAAAAERKGREEGRKEGERAAGERYAKSVEELRKGIRGVLEALSREKAALFLGYEGEAVALSASAIKRVFEGLADGHAESVLPLLRKAVAALGEVAAFTLKINPADFRVIDDNRPFWLPVEAGLKDIRIVPDARVPRGGCLVESDATSIEMRAAELGERIGEALAQVFEAKARAAAGEPAPLEPAPPDPAPESSGALPAPANGVPAADGVPAAGAAPAPAADAAASADSAPSADADDSMPPVSGTRP